MRRISRSVALCAWFVWPVSTGSVAQPAAPADPLQPLAFLVGRWEGTSNGEPGSATVQREYTRVLNSKFIQGRNRTVYPPQDKNPKGEAHEHFSMFSFDKTRQRAVLRQFHLEGFVNQYAAEIAAVEGAKIVFTSEAIENIPPGWRARETYTVLGPDEFEEIFELAEPGKSFDLYSRARLKRIR